jgi:hypothetical protein
VPGRAALVADGIVQAVQLARPPALPGGTAPLVSPVLSPRPPVAAATPPRQTAPTPAAVHR